MNRTARQIGWALGSLLHWLVFYQVPKSGGATLTTPKMVSTAEWDGGDHAS